MSKTPAQLARDSIAEVVGACYYSPIRETNVDGIHGLRLFYDHGKSILIEYLDSTESVIGVEFFDGVKTYLDSPGEIHVTFGRLCPLSDILPFVKDFVQGKVTESGGLYRISD